MVQRFTTLDCLSGNPGSIPGRIADDNFSLVLLTTVCKTVGIVMLGGRQVVQLFYGGLLTASISTVLECEPDKFETKVRLFPSG